MTASHAFVVLAGLAASRSVVGAAILLVRLRALPTGPDAVREGVSAYAPTRWANLYQAQVIASRVAASLLVVGCGVMDPGSTLGLGALLVYAVPRVAIVRYPTDPPATTALSAPGRAHVSVAPSYSAGGWPRLRPRFRLVERVVYVTGFSGLLIVGAGLSASSLG